MESPYPHLYLTACELLNDVNTLTDLRKNTENYPNNRKTIASFVECNFSTMASLMGCLPAVVSSQHNEQARSVKQESILSKTYSSSKISKNQFPKKVKFGTFSQVLSHKESSP